MATAVAVPLSAINEQLGGVLPPSALVQHTPRHGRSRGMSVKGKGRSYSVVEDRDVSIAKALMFVLKRTIKESEVDEEDEVDNLVEDAEGWVSVDDVLAHEKLTQHETTLEDVQRVVSNAIKARFNLRQKPKSTTYQIQRITNRDSLPAPLSGPPLLPTDADLPEYLIYETSYARYPLLLTQGSITRAPGGGEYLSFTPVTGEKEPEAEVSIWINLKDALESGLVFQKTENGSVVTSGEVAKGLWKKAVARRPDVGLLFEDGEVRKDVPAALRGKGGKARKGKGERRERRGSASEEDKSGSADEEE